MAIRTKIKVYDGEQITFYSTDNSENGFIRAESGDIVKVGQAGLLADSLDLLGTGSVGEVTNAKWRGNTIEYDKGGTEQTSWSKGDLLYASADNTLSKLSIGATEGLVLTANSSGEPEWTYTIGKSGTTLVIQGNLNVQGQTLNTDTETVTIADNIMELNSNLTGSDTPTESSGMEINRGSETFASLIWDENSDWWKAGLKGSEKSLVDISTAQDLTNKTYNGLILTSQSTGYTISGGTTSKILTLNANLTANTSINLTGTTDEISVSGSTTLSSGGSVGSISISNSYPGQKSIYILGSTGKSNGPVSQGTWEADVIELEYGGTGLESADLTAGDILYYSSGTSSYTTVPIGNNYEVLQSDGSKPVWQQNLDLKGTNTTPGTGTITSGNIMTVGSVLMDSDTHSISADPFSPGFAGFGWKIYNSPDTLSEATFDNLTIRGIMNVYELQIQQIRATNGSVFVTSAAKVVDVTNVVDNTGTDGTMSADLVIDDEMSYVPFAAGDLLRAQEVHLGNNGTIYQCEVLVNSIDNANNKFNVTWAKTSSGSVSWTGTVSNNDPEAGREFVRIGSTSSSARQGTVYLTADDTNAPFIDIVDGITKFQDWNTSGNIKVKLGKLDGVTDSDVGLVGITNLYGLYSDSAYLKGNLIVGGGNEIGQLNNTIAIGNIATGTPSNAIKITNTGTTSTSGIFGYDGSQNETFALILDDGTASHIAGWKFNSTILSSTNDNITLDSSNEKIYIGTGDYNNSNTAFYVDGTSQFSLGDKLSWNGTTLTVEGSITTTDGDVAGFTIGTDTISATGITLTSSQTAANSSIALGSATALSTGTGFWTDGAGNFRVGGASNNHLKYDGSITIKADNAEIAGTTGWLSNSTIFSWNATSVTAGGWTITNNLLENAGGDGVLRLATGAWTTASNRRAILGKLGTGVYGLRLHDTSGNTIFEASDTQLKMAGYCFSNTKLWAGNAVIGSSATTMVLDSSTPAIKLGVSADYLTVANNSDPGFVVNGSGEFRAYQGSQNYLRIDSAGVDLKSEKLSIETTKVHITETYLGLGGTAAPTASNSGTGIYIDSTGLYGLNNGTQNFKLNATDGTLFAQSADISGTINASAGVFTGSVSAGGMEFGVNVNGSNGGIYIDSNDYWYDSGNFSLGNGNVTWDGSNLNVSGNITAKTGYIGGNTNGWVIDTNIIYDNSINVGITTDNSQFTNIGGTPSKAILGNYYSNNWGIWATSGGFGNTNENPYILLDSNGMRIPDDDNIDRVHFRLADPTDTANYTSDGWRKPSYGSEKIVDGGFHSAFFSWDADGLGGWKKTGVVGITNSMTWFDSNYVAQIEGLGFSSGNFDHYIEQYFTCDANVTYLLSFNYRFASSLGNPTAIVELLYSTDSASSWNSAKTIQLGRMFSGTLNKVISYFTPSSTTHLKVLFRHKGNGEASPFNFYVSDVTVKQVQHFTEINDTGFYMYASDSNYIKMGKNEFTIKTADFTLDNLTVENNIEIYGNLTVRGNTVQLGSSITADAFLVLNNSANIGSSTEYGLEINDEGGNNPMIIYSEAIGASGELGGWAVTYRTSGPEGTQEGYTISDTDRIVLRGMSETLTNKTMSSGCTWNGNTIDDGYLTNNYQPLNTKLTNLSNLSTPYGFIVHSNTNTFVKRSISVDNGLTITNADGVDANPEISISGYTGESTITTLGTITGSATWNASVISPTYGGTGLSSYTQGDILYASDSSTLVKLSIDSNKTVLQSNGTSPYWASNLDMGSGNIITTEELCGGSVKINGITNNGMFKRYDLEVPVGGIAESTNVTIPDGGSYVRRVDAALGTYDTKLMVFVDGFLMRQYPGATDPTGNTDYENKYHYWEVSSTSVKFNFDIAEGGLISFVILKW